ncbi:hypothetical protein [Polyangium jinanense]|uniref:hypothetical protein n=1 Tax=Polyangium jinanense TaxID=2829994 RepID=UPI0023409B4A|nr:hypothetical protein [Polyangium jinanense]
MQTTRAALEDLKTRHIAFLKARLTSPAARAEWQKTVADVLDELRFAPLGRLVEPSSLARALDSAITKQTVDGSLRPAIERLAREVHAVLVKERATIGSFVSGQAQKDLAALFARPDVLPPKLVREIAESEAAREVMREVMHDALKQFSERVNPFVAEWGLPSLMKKLGPFGLGGVGKSIDGLRVDFEKRLDPEIRKFLLGFSQKAVKNAAESIVARAGDPPFVALRQRLAGFLLEQRFAEVLLDVEATKQGTRIGVDIAAHLAANEELATRRRAFVLAWVKENEAKPVSEVFASLGLPDKPPREIVTALADATFPALTATIGTPAAQSWLASIVAEFYDGLVASDEPPPTGAGEG